ncbi:MAG TPA: MaoC/PaaZ C-terminal domain-containing protein, partial [Candidatus Binataceae bacterium]|nr:MaoC/PaaZ C-terminal domain-containing protein [Candidatus Binataceae bacterium]
YARAYNDPNPRFFDPATPGGIVAPPMFAVVVTWLPVLSAMTDPELHADLLRLLHSAQDMEFLAPLHPGDLITAASTVASIESAAGGETMALSLEAQNQLGQTVNRTTFTVFIRGRRDTGAPTESRAPAAARAPRPLLVVAQTIDPDQTFRYAEASGDRNPIHVDHNVAKMAGLPGIIVHGLCTMAFTSKVMIDNLCAGDPTHLKRLRVRFSRPVFPGDTIATTVWPAGTRAGRHTFTYETCNAEGLAVIRDGIAEVDA